MRRVASLCTFLLGVSVMAAPQPARATDLDTFTLLGDYPTPGMPYDVRVRGGLAYLAYYVDASTAVFEVLDVSHPAQPTRVGALVLAHAPNDYVLPFAVALAGNLAYVSMYYGGFVIVDVSDPGNPLLAGSYVVNGGNGDAMQGIVVDGGILYAGWDWRHGLGIFDVSDPSAPRLLSEFGGIGYARMVLKKDQYVFVSTYYSGAIQIIDVINPAAPRAAGSIPTPGASYYIGDMQGDLFLLADRSATYGLRLHSLVEPRQPELVGQFNTGALGFGDVGNARLFGTEALVTFNHRVALFDVSAPQTPQLMSVLSLVDNNSLLFDFDGTRLYVPGNAGLSIYGPPAVPMGCFSADEFRYWEMTMPWGWERASIATSGGLALASPARRVEYLAAGAAMRINDLELVVPADAWTQTADGDPIYAFENGRLGHWSLELAFTRGEWKLEYAGEACCTPESGSGVTTTLMLGALGEAEEGVATFMPVKGIPHGRQQNPWIHHGPASCAEAPE